MRMLTVLIFLCAFFVMPVYAEDVTETDEDVVLSSAERKRQAKLSNMNDAQIFEQQMLERRAQNSKRKKTKKISGTYKSSSSKKVSQTKSSQKSSSSSSGVPSLASGMFIK